jgi:hypothetical protein
MLHAAEIQGEKGWPFVTRTGKTPGRRSPKGKRLPPDPFFHCSNKYKSYTKSLPFVLQSRRLIQHTALFNTVQQKKIISILKQTHEQRKGNQSHHGPLTKKANCLLLLPGISVWQGAWWSRQGLWHPGGGEHYLNLEYWVCVPKKKNFRTHRDRDQESYE